MCIVWEEKIMRKCLPIIRYEYRMQLNNRTTWGLLIVATAIALIDSYPSAKNLVRLEFLVNPTYFIYRTMSIEGLVLVFGLMFLLSNRILLDQKTGVKSLMMASSITKGQYVFGKLLGGFLFTFTMLALFLTLNTVIYFVAVSADISIVDCLILLIKTLVICGLPVSLFISFLSVALSAVMDMRLFYLLASVLFILNAASVSSAEQMPFYLITSGDLIKLIWQHPRVPFTNAGSVQANLIFLVGCGLVAWVLLLIKPKFWRAE